MRPNVISKRSIIIIVVVVVIAIAYFYFTGDSAPSAGNLQAESGGVGQNEISLLNHVKALNVDTGFFNDPAYKSLVDYTVEITPEPVGRQNPFAPVPGVPNPQTAPATAGGR